MDDFAMIALLAAVSLALGSLGLYWVLGGATNAKRAGANKSLSCPGCQAKLERPANLGPIVECSQCGKWLDLPHHDSIASIRLGYMCAGVALAFCPPAFVLVSVIFGIANLDRGFTGRGIAWIIAAILMAAAGVLLVAWMIAGW